MQGRINWKRLVKRIPIQIRTSDKDVYPVVFVKDFADGKTLGETRFDPNTIAIMMNQPAKLTVHVYLHEVIHAISATYNIGLTENQVLALEDALIYILKPGNLFEEEK